MIGSNTPPRLIRIKHVTGTIHLLSGLRIGANKELMSIGDVDNPVIRNPLSGEPYIPGSSVKGKMRSLIEWSLGGEYLPSDERSRNHVYHSEDPKDPVGRVFGLAPNSPADKEIARQRGPTRLILRDALLTPDSRDQLLARTAERGSLYTEVKQEVFIPRLGGDANPRMMERVPAGAQFGFEASYRVLDMGEGGELDEQLFKDVVVKAFALLQLDALGGSSSCGYGQIRFDDLKVDGAVLTLSTTFNPV